MSLRKPFKRGPVWYCEVDRRRVSLKTKDKAEALSRFAEIRRRYLQQLAGTPIRSECLMTIGDFADEYMEWAPKAIKSPNTVNNAFIALKKLLAITKRSLPLSDVHPKHIDLLIAANRDRKSSSINCYIRFSRIVMNKAVSWGYIKENPFRSVKYLREDIEPPRFIPPDEVLKRDSQYRQSSSYNGVYILGASPFGAFGVALGKYQDGKRGVLYRKHHIKIQRVQMVSHAPYVQGCLARYRGKGIWACI